MAFGNDAVERLISGFGRSYAYDNADNLIQTATPAGAAVTQHFDDANQLTSRSSGATTLATFGYDDEGRRTDTTPRSGAATHLDWSQGDDLLSYSGPDRRPLCLDLRDGLCGDRVGVDDGGGVAVDVEARWPREHVDRGGDP